MKKNKIQKRVEVSFNFDWTYGVDIKQIREDLDALEKLGVTRIEIEPDSNYGSCCVSIQAFTDRTETDEEYNKRISEETQRKKNIKDSELEELARLKAKYKL